MIRDFWLIRDIRLMERSTVKLPIANHESPITNHE